jgi:hypothetical protein
MLTFDLQTMSLISRQWRQRTRMALVPSTFDASHYLQSSLREKLLEHLFIGELGRELWKRGRRDVEILRAEIDFAGYDLVLECNGVLRHVQLKSSHLTANTRKVTVHMNLCEKPCGCVVWIKFDEDTLKLGPFLWLGGSPTEKLWPLGNQPALRTTRNRMGVRPPRKNLREVSASKFTELPTMSDLVTKLFGAVTSASQSAETTERTA